MSNHVVVVTLLQGRYFPNTKLYVNATFNNEILSTDPSIGPSPIFDTELIWQLTHKQLSFLKSQRSNIKIIVYSIENNIRTALGFLMLNLRSAAVSTKTWFTLQNNHSIQKPQLLLKFSVSPEQKHLPLVSHLMVTITLSFVENLALFGAKEYYFIIKYASKTIRLLTFTNDIIPERITFTAGSAVDHEMNIYLYADEKQVGSVVVTGISRGFHLEKRLPIISSIGDNHAYLGLSVTVRSAMDSVHTNINDDVKVTVERIEDKNSLGITGSETKTIIVPEPKPVELLQTSENNIVENTGQTNIQEKSQMDPAESQNINQQTVNQSQIINQQIINETTTTKEVYWKELNENNIQPPAMVSHHTTPNQTPVIDPIVLSSSPVWPSKSIHTNPHSKSWHNIQISIDIRNLAHPPLLKPLEIFTKYWHRLFGPQATITTPTVINTIGPGILSHSFKSFQILISYRHLIEMLNQPLIIDIVRVVDGIHEQRGSATLPLHQLMEVGSTAGVKRISVWCEVDGLQDLEVANEENELDSNELGWKLLVVATLEDFGPIDIPDTALDYLQGIEPINPILGAGGLIGENEIGEEEYLSALQLEMWKQKEQEKFNELRNIELQNTLNQIEIKNQQLQSEWQLNLQETLGQYQTKLDEAESIVKELKRKENALKIDQDTMRRKIDEYKSKSKEYETILSRKDSELASLQLELTQNTNLYKQNLEQVNKAHQIEMDKVKRELLLKTKQVEDYKVELGKFTIIASDNQRLVQARHELKKKYKFVVTKLRETEKQLIEYRVNQTRLYGELEKQEQVNQVQQVEVMKKQLEKLKLNERQYSEHKEGVQTKVDRSVHEWDEQVGRLKKQLECLMQSGYDENDQLVVAISKAIDDRLNK